MQSKLKSLILGLQDFFGKSNQLLICNILILNLVLFLIHAWYLQNYIGLEVTERLSFRGEDPTWMPPGQTSIPILGVHHFGDFQIIAGYANAINPYDPTLALQAQYLPFTFVLAKFLLLFGLKGAFIIYSLLTLFFLFVPVLLIVRKSQVVSPLLFICLVFFLTQPFLTIFDRGNLQGLMSGFIFMSYYFYSIEKRKLAFIFLICASLLKGYPILLLLFLQRDRIRNFLFGIFALTFLTFASFLLLKLNPFQAINGYMLALKISQGSCFTCGYSPSSLMDKAIIILLPNFQRSDLILLNITLSLAILGMGILISQRDNSLIPIKTVFVGMSFLQVFPSLSNNFTLIWAVIPLIVLCDSRLDKHFLTGLNPARLLIIISCLVSIMPNLILVQGPRDHATWLMSLLSPAIILVTYIFLVKDSTKLELKKPYKT